jgi:ATP-dependent Clp protease ATP-binding subunit ClpC
VLDDGRLTDGKGRVVNFTNTVIIATSNLASDVIMGASKSPPGFATREEHNDTRAAVMGILQQHFKPEFLNRLDEIIIFESLTAAQIREIVAHQLERVRRAAHGQDVSLSFDDSLVDHLGSTAYNPRYGARELRRRIRESLGTELARQMIGGLIKEGDQVQRAADADSTNVVLTATSAAEQAAEALLDKALEESFPASDPPAFVEDGVTADK